MPNKVAVITGGSSGIGLATARLLRDKEYLVISADVNPLEEIGIHSHYCDVTKTSSVQELFQWVLKMFGRLDYLLLSAGIHQSIPLLETEEGDYDSIANVKMKGTWNGIRFGAPIMEKGGCIVTVSSDTGLIPDRDSPLYTASNNWIIGITKVASLDLIRRGIRVNCVCPGATDTPFLRKAFGYSEEAIKACGESNPIGRLGTAEEVARVIALQMENEFVNGAIWNVDGGYSWDKTAEPTKA